MFGVRVVDVVVVVVVDCCGRSSGGGGELTAANLCEQNETVHGIGKESSPLVQTAQKQKWHDTKYAPPPLGVQDVREER